MVFRATVTANEEQRAREYINILRISPYLQCTRTLRRDNDDGQPVAFCAVGLHNFYFPTRLFEEMGMDVLAEWRIIDMNDSSNMTFSEIANSLEKELTEVYII